MNLLRCSQTFGLLLSLSCPTVVADRPAVADAPVAPTAPAAPAAPSLPASPDSPASKAPLAAPMLERVGVVGASVTAGFKTVVPATVDGTTADIAIRFGDVIGCTLAEPKPPVVEAGSIFFFASPEAQGKLLADRASAADPSLLVAVDFLFWFGYGVVEPPELATRLARLDAGLALLDAFPCPMIVGDFPDMSAAVGRMLMPEQMPSAEALRALNERLRAWAAERPRVKVFPLGDLVQRMSGGEPITIGATTWPADRVPGLLQRDRLHPTVEGMVALSLQVAELACSLDPTLRREAFAPDAETVRSRLQPLAEDRLRKRLESAK